MELIKNWSNLYIEAGCDEVGRGCLSGPVVAAAVILDDEFKQNLVNDSKKLTFKTRMELDSYIKDNVKNYAIAELPPSFIDKHNILNASIHAMHRALDQLTITPNLFWWMATNFIRIIIFPINVSLKEILKYYPLQQLLFLQKITG
jgi:ribonuclease HII